MPSSSQLQWSGGIDTLVASAARTTTDNSAALPGFGSSSTLRVQLNATAASGTNPTLDVVVEDSLDGSNWNTIGTFAQLGAAGREVINITTPFADQLRVTWTIGGTATPTFTFAVIAVYE